MTLEEIEARLGVLEDIEAIKQLRASYAYMSDTYNWQGMLKLFTDDAVADFGSFGRYQGKEELTKFFRDIAPQAVSFLMHMNHNPIIKVKGMTATGKWYWELPATLTEANRAMWQAGAFEDEYVKVDGEWKIKTMLVQYFYFTPFDEGWVKTKMFGQ